MKSLNYYLGEYFKNSVNYLIKSYPIFFIFIFIDCIEVWISAVVCVEDLFYLNKNTALMKTDLADIVSKASPYEYFVSYMSKENDNHGFNTNHIVILIYVFSFAWFGIYVLVRANNDPLKNENLSKKILDIISVNYFEYFLYRFAAFFGFDAIFREMLKIVFLESPSINEMIILFVLIILLGVMIYVHIIQFSRICLYCNFNILDSEVKRHPYDSHFSAKFDLVYFAIKVLITFNKNYIIITGYTINYIFLLVLCMKIVIFLIYVISVAITIFSDRVLFINMNHYNKLRLFFLLFLFETLFLRTLLHSNEDYIPFIFYSILLVIFNIIIICGVLDTFIFVKATKSQNYLGVCWYLQNNNINLFDFSLEWIANHSKNCALGSKQCPICSKIVQDIQKVKDDNVQKNFFLKDKKNNKDKEISAKNLAKTKISSLFPPFKFLHALVILARYFTYDLSKEDLVKLDIVYLNTLLFTEENISFSIFSNFYTTLIKHQSIPIVYTTVLMAFEIVKKIISSSNNEYEMIKLNEELNDTLTKYINDYQEFIMYQAKTPVNYVNISLKYKKFKDLLKNITTYFKQNIENNYQLIIMRYCYETIIHNHHQNTSNFDLNNFSEFLEYYYKNNKSILLKYRIEQDDFIIIQAGKEINKYQGYLFNIIFPAFLKKIEIERFKSYLSDIESIHKPFFEFIVNDITHNQQYNFVEIFRIKYKIYPPIHLNEPYIHAIYKNGYSSIMIFKVFEDKEILYTFSYQIFKTLGITPNILQLLKNERIEISFSDLFKEENLISTENEKFTYKFSFFEYYNILKKILSSPLIKDNFGYTQCSEKAKEIDSLGLTKKEIIFSVYKKCTFPDKNCFYNIYVIKEVKKKPKGTIKFKINQFSQVKKNTQATLNENDILNSESQDNESKDKSDFDSENENYNGKDMLMAVGSVMSSTSFSSGRESSLLSGYRGDKKKQNEKKTGEEVMQRFTIIIFILSLFVIIVTVIFLFLELSKNSYFSKLISLFHSFKIFKRGLESVPVCVLSNYNFINNNVSVRLYEEYSLKLAQRQNYTFLSQLNISKVIIKQVNDNLSPVITNFEAFHKEIYLLGTKLIGQISALESKTYSLTQENDKIYYIIEKTNLITLFRQYLNVLSILFNNDIYTKLNVSLLNFIKDQGLNKVQIGGQHTVVLNESIKNMMLVLLMYPNIHDGLNNIVTIVDSELYSTIKILRLLFIVFYIFIFTFHCILLFIALTFLLSFIRSLKEYLESANRLFSDKKFVELQLKRIEQINIMKSLYEEDPNKIYEKIENLEAAYKNKIIEQNNKELKRKENQLLDNIDIQSYETKNSTKTDSTEDNKSDTKKNSLKYKKNDSFETKENADSAVSNQTNELSLFIENHKIITKETNFKKSKYIQVITKQLFILAIINSIHLICSLIVFIVVYKATDKLNILLEYVAYNDAIDGNIYDISNVILYLIITNTTSIEYSEITDSNSSKDYLSYAINDFSDGIVIKKSMEYKYDDFFPLHEKINLNCSVGIIQDSGLTNVLNYYNVNFENYFKELCQEFSVAQSNRDSLVYSEISYLMDIIYRKIERSDFDKIFNNLDNTMLFDLFTLILTFNKMIRTYFNENFLMAEVNGILNYFSSLIYAYISISIILELFLISILIFVVIYGVKRINTLLITFLSSLNFG